MVVTNNADNDSAVTCTDCEWLGYAANATSSDAELTCPDCGAELQFA